MTLLHGIICNNIIVNHFSTNHIGFVVFIYENVNGCTQQLITYKFDKAIPCKCKYANKTNTYLQISIKCLNSSGNVNAYPLGVLIFTKNSNFNECQVGCHYTAKNKNFLLKKFFSSYHTAIAQLG